MLNFQVYHASKNAPWVTFVHGAGGSSSIWYKQLRAFKGKFNLLLIDLRGHGKSKTTRYEEVKNYDFDSICDDVIDVLDHLDIKNTHWVGISLGTIIIRQISERYPNRTASMTLGGAVMKLNFRGILLMRTGAALKSLLPYMVLYRFFAWVIMPRSSHRESRRLFVKEAKKLYQKEFKRWFTLTSQVKPILKSFRRNETRVPTLYIMGSQDHMFLQSIKKLVSYHRNANLHVIANCGHVVNVEQPDIFNKKVMLFIQSIP
jgi:pimeloyl-ACP methyl ester carboxylesterase